MHSCSSILHLNNNYCSFSTWGREYFLKIRSARVDHGMFLLSKVKYNWNTWYSFLSLSTMVFVFIVEDRQWILHIRRMIQRIGFLEWWARFHFRKGKSLRLYPRAGRMWVEFCTQHAKTGIFQTTRWENLELKNVYYRWNFRELQKKLCWATNSTFL